MRTTTELCLGVLLGFLVYWHVSTCEQYQLYRLRKAITGKTVMSEIYWHPADPYIAPGVFCLSLAGSVVLVHLLGRVVFRRR